VARQAHNLKVTGSNPVPATNTKPRIQQDDGPFCVLHIANGCTDVLPRIHAIGKLARQMKTSDAARPIY
ncbi:hypothetical protein, partial [Sphingomonas sp. CFBP 13720]|uniref:hypothetical protein n=1 Tax=Sphingomonas sp. CFBP 13720 TaxID=2775302 RepID=UPI001A7EC328